MVARLAECAGPSQHGLETEAGQRNGPLSLPGVLSHWPGKKAEALATFVDVARQGLQAFIGTVSWDQLHARCGLHLSPSPASIPAQRVGPILPSSHPSVPTTT
jgi:hypothetical protein